MPCAASLSSTPQEKPRLWALITLFFAPAFVFANMYSTQAILPVLSSAFHVAAPTAGLTVSVLVLAVAIGSLVYGPLADRIGRKPVMVGVSFIVVIPTLLAGLAPNFITLVVLRALQGLLMPGLSSVAISYVNEEFAGKRLGLTMGIYVSGLTVGGLFARAGSAAVTGLFNWRSPCPHSLTRQSILMWTSSPITAICMDQALTGGAVHCLPTPRIQCTASQQNTNRLSGLSVPVNSRMPPTLPFISMNIRWNPAFPTCAGTTRSTHRSTRGYFSPIISTPSMTPVPAGLAYYTWYIPQGNLCMFGVVDAHMDCGPQSGISCAAQ